MSLLSILDAGCEGASPVWWDYSRGMGGMNRNIGGAGACLQGWDES